MAFEKSSAGSAASGGAVGPDGQFSDPSGLATGMFPEHPKTGDWESLKGMAMSPYELDAIESDSAHAGVARGNAPSSAVAPSSTIDVNTPMTMGGGTYAK